MSEVLPLICIFGCKDPVAVVIHAPNGCLCANNKYQPRCMHHLNRLRDTNEDDYAIVEDFRIYE